MTRDETEYRDAVARAVAGDARLRDERAALVARGFTPDEVDLATAAVRSFHEQLRDEIAAFERPRSDG